MYEQVCLCVLACVFLCERDVINITLTIVKYVTEVIRNCKSTTSVYMLKCPEIPALDMSKNLAVFLNGKN